MIYDVDYFINKFEAIPEEKWTPNATACAYTHCGQYLGGYKTECPALSELFKTIHHLSENQKKRDEVGDTYHGWSYLVACINDNNHLNDTPYKQPTPKQRILAALYDIKAMTEPKDIDTGGKKERIVYVAVPASITEQSKDLVLS